MTFLDDTQTNSAAIVYRKQEAKYAHLMAQLISAYAEYEVAEWEEKDWLAEKALTTSSQNVIFFGDAGKEYKLGTKWKYDEFGMRYGWLGKKCVCEVKSLPAKKVKDFITHYNNRAEHYEINASQKRVDGKPLQIAAASWVVGGIPLSMITYFVTKAVGDTTKFSEHQYQLLIYEFIFKGDLKKFMEAK